MLIFYLPDASYRRRHDSVDRVVTITRTADSARQTSHAMRSHFDKNGKGLQLTVPDFDLETVQSSWDRPEEIGIEVKIERTVHVTESRRSHGYELENYSRSGTST